MHAVCGFLADDVKIMAMEEGKIKDGFMVDLSKLFIGPKFARGADSQIYRGTYEDEPVALKILQLSDDGDDDKRRETEYRLTEQFNNEVALLSRLRHQNVIKFVGAHRDSLGIVTEYLSGGSLRSYLNERGGNRALPIPTVIRMALDIARGMEYLHSQGVVHRDLKPENILIDQELFRLKVADFGLSCRESDCHHSRDSTGTYRWMAPEVIKRKTQSRKVDVYSFGLILWALVAGEVPFLGLTPVQVAVAVANMNRRPEIPGRCPQAIKLLIRQCWALEPNKRPEFWQIVKELEQFQFQTLHMAAAPRQDRKNKILVPRQDHKNTLHYWMHKLTCNLWMIL